ncbi:isoleucine--tRNA ligase [Nisaea nitritireducens]|uniref:isoleucine--tRNA ligase n=1 Tax=Nisaea nitritireducens TaxID=568392 RepID=UPI001867CC4F|nr:isoleucine--tRNA ligase [Nisaea nitritireducens]
MSVDYKTTVFLPKTDFPMRGNLPTREPEILAHWEEIGLRKKLRESRAGAEKFILHDGPPYANGNLHMGHALNKVLKDVINRSQQMLGKDANYVPGWDCHGLPIEWKIEEQYREKGLDKDTVPVIEFRRECREFAQKWVDIQTEEFKRLGVSGDWEQPYLTMTFPAEAQIAREIGKFIMNGGLYKGAKPVMWSVVEKTALADAEVEYHDHKSVTIHVRFPVVEAKHPAVEGAAVVIWTTTPWTMPGNRAVAAGEEFEYVVIEVGEVSENSLAKPGEKLVVGVDLLDQVKQAAKIESATELARVTGADIAGSVLAHPLRGQGYDYDVPLLLADFVTTDAGTGFVHIAPGHGADDFVLGNENGLEIPQTVADDGYFYDHVPIFAGMHVLEDNLKISAILRDAGGLLARGSITHSYPHSWRSKAPLIFRNTPQWFISMETNELRETALKAIDETRFVPQAGQTRLRSMIEQRPDWCISRQRTWGVPIPVFVEKKTGEMLRDQAVIDRIGAIFEEEGSDAWFTSEPSRFLGNDYNADDYEQNKDIVEVWFESGSTHSFVLEQRPDLQWPADLYLEGSDQHRGWFHSSLLESCGTRGRAPYNAVLTHGFVLDENGRKMSKSLGNITAPQDVIGQSGADILRLWVVNSDYSEDLRVGKEILKHQADQYRRLRNTLRYLLGNLDGFTEAERLPVDEMPELERWVLHRLWELDAMIREKVEAFDFHALFTQLHNFCAVDLSAFYFDIRKDSFYCDRPDSVRRRAARTVLDEVFNRLTAWLAPVLCFTAEEAWTTRGMGAEESVHLRTFPETPESWRDDAVAARWAEIRNVRRVVTGALELERNAKRIGSSLQAAPDVHVSEAALKAFDGLDAAEIFITSGAELIAGEGPEEAFRLEDVEGIAVVPALADGGKCERCWKVLPEVVEPPVCKRCADAVSTLETAAE